MAEAYRPGQTARGQQQTTETDPSSNWYKNQGDQDRRANLWHYSSIDPRMTGEQRLDQRYQNYTYGTDPGYATRQAGSLQERGTGAQSTLGAYGDRASGQADAITTRTTPTTNYSTAQQVFGQQQGTANRLTDFAMQGPGPSRAQADLEANTAAAQRFALSQAGSGRGAGGGASAARQAMAQNAITQGGANAAASTLAAQEQDAFQGRKLQALGQQGNLLTGMAAQQAGQAQFVTQAELDAQAQRDNASLGYSQLGLDAQQQGYATDLAYNEAARAEFENEAQANQAYEENVTSLANAKAAADAAKAKDEGGTLDTVLGVAGAAGGIAAMFSDERGKTNMRPDDDLNDRYAALVVDPYADDDRDRRKREREREREREEQEAKDADRRAAGFQMAIGGARRALKSDERSKERIQELEELNDRYAALVDIRDPYADETAAAHAPASSTTYEYKNPEQPGAGRGRYTGPMAQELEGIPGVVKDTRQGKMVDPGRLTMANTSAIGSLERRQRALEAANPTPDYVFDSNEEGGEGRKVQYHFGADTDLDTRYETLNDAPAPRRARPVDTTGAPTSAAVQQALHSFSKEPTEAEIAQKREELRAQYGSGAASEFERYAMAYRKNNRSPIHIGEATIEG